MTSEQALAHSVALTIKTAMHPLIVEIAELKTKNTELAARPYVAKELVESLQGTVTDLRARLSVVEGRAPVPGPPGAPGERGLDGKDGTEGKPGVAGKDVDPERVVTLVAEHVQKAVAVLPTPAPGKDADMALIQIQIESGIAEAVAALPPPAPGKDADPETVTRMVAEHVSKAVAALPPAMPGKDADMSLVLDTIDTSVAKAVSAIPAPKDGSSVTVNDVAPLIVAEVQKAMEAIPTPQDGRSVTVNDVTPLIVGEIQKRIEALPKAKDGIGFTGAVVTQEGRLVLTRTDGGTQDVGPVIKGDLDAEIKAQVQKAAATIPAQVREAVAALPSPENGKDGRDVDLAALDVTVKGHVERTVAALPVPKDGLSITVDDVAPLVTAEVTKAVAQIPIPRDGRDGDAVVDALIDRDGHLVVTLSDGTTKNVGTVVGKNADPEEVARIIAAEVAKIPAPLDGKDGADGLGFEDAELVFDELKGYLLRWTNGTQTKERPIPLPFDAGVWKPGRTYPAGAGVTVKGAWFIAQSPTSARPGDENQESRAWRLAVKGGKDGKPGRDGRNGGES